MTMASSSQGDAKLLEECLSKVSHQAVKDFMLEQLSLAAAKEESPTTLLKRLEALAKEEESLVLEAQEYLASLEVKSNEPSQAINEEEDELAELEATVKTLEREVQEVLMKQAQLDSLDEDSFIQCENHLIRLMDERQVVESQQTERSQKIGTQRSENEKKLEALTRTDALNEAFFIWHEGPFATINGLRLGCLPHENVEWNEINAAFGFAALLLDSVAKDVGFDFFVWRVLPCGSQSLMVNVQNSSQTLNLFCNTTWLWKTSFNAGISAFADCVDELGDFARREDPSILLPHKVDRSTIGGISVHYSNSPEWTRAMKYLLTDIKWLVMWAVKRKHTMLASLDLRRDA